MTTTKTPFAGLRELVPLDWGEYNFGVPTGISKQAAKLHTETIKEELSMLQEELTIDCLAGIGDDGSPSLVIGVDDTVLNDYDGGPCAKFTPWVKIKSLSALVMAELSGEGYSDDFRELVLEKWIEWLGQQTVELRRELTRRKSK